jgi:RNA polymerase sigma-70 factor (ECF subfamily)
MIEPFQILAAEYRPMLVDYLRALLKDDHLAEDLAQESLLDAHQALDKFTEGENFGRWLRGIARNRALRHWRSARRKPLLIDSRVVAGVDEVFEEWDRSQEEGDWWESRQAALRDCLSRLSAQLRNAIEEVYFQKRSLTDAATVLSSTHAAVSQRLSRARSGLRICVREKLQSETNND